MKTAMRIVSKGYFNSIDQFYLQKDVPLGVGSFGTVRLGIHIKTNKPYAIKIVDIGDGMSQNQLKILQRQILLHSSLDHPHIIKLWDTIREGNKIYMIMEYASSGSLFHYQNKYTRFSEQEGYRYFYQTLDGLRYLHSQNIMHRDIKPQNLLLDNEKNIKICDFGWATQNIHQKRSTFCGTYEYMAPQMAYQKQYDYKIDIWALGILLFQLIHGYAPFKAKTLDDIKERISKGSYQISNTCSKQLKNLIMSILQFDPKDRPTIQEICLNDWVIKIPKIILAQLLIQQQNCKKQKQKQKQREKEKQKEKWSSKDIHSHNLSSASKKNMHRKISNDQITLLQFSNQLNQNQKLNNNFMIQSIGSNNRFSGIIENSNVNNIKNNKYKKYQTLNNQLQNKNSQPQKESINQTKGYFYNTVNQENNNNLSSESQTPNENGKLNFNKNLRKNINNNEDPSGNPHQQQKRMFKKKCKTQGQQNIQKNISYGGSSFTNANNTGSSFLDGKLFNSMNNNNIGGNHLLSPGNINVVSMNASTPQNNHQNYHSTIKRQNSSGSNLNLQIVNVSTPVGNNGPSITGNHGHSNHNSYNNFHPFSVGKENSHNYSNSNSHFNTYTNNKVQTLCAESYRNSGMDQINFGTIFASSHQKPINKDSSSITVSNKKKLEQKISELTTKYTTDKRKLKAKQIKQYA